jgi:hypothetical protein
VSNAALLRDFVRPAMVSGFGLAPSGFVPSDPFMWTGSASLALPGVGTAIITSMTAFVNEANQIVLTFSFNTRLVDGAISVSASISVPVDVVVTSRGGSLIATFTPAPATVNSSRVDVAAWVYVAIAFGGGLVLLGALALADAIADGAISGPLATAVNGAVAASTVPIPLPTGLPTLAVSGVSLFQADALRRTIRIGVIALPAPGRDHNMVVRLA